MKTLLLSLVLCFSGIMIYAQDSSQSNASKGSNEFGIHVGSTTGIGLSYRHWFNKFGIQVTGLPYKGPKNFFTSAAITAMYSFIETTHIRGFIYLGNDFIFQKTYHDTPGSSTSSDNRWNIGFGPGFSFGKTVTFNIMAGYGFYDITGAQLMLPTGEIGLYFNF